QARRGTRRRRPTHSRRRPPFARDREGRVHVPSRGAAGEPRSWTRESRPGPARLPRKADRTSQSSPRSPAPPLPAAPPGRRSTSKAPGTDLAFGLTWSSVRRRRHVLGRNQEHNPLLATRVGTAGIDGRDSVDDRDRHPRITRDVARLARARPGEEDHPLTFDTDPHRHRMRCTAGQHGRDMRLVCCLAKLSYWPPQHDHPTLPPKARRDETTRLVEYRRKR